MPEFLNLGCGARWHPAFVNVDFAPRSPEVIRHDLRKGIPFADARFDAVYHSHVLEHFSRADAPAFLRECRRVLKPGGVIRIAVPDLEGIARAYIECLDRAARGEAGAESQRDWLALELLDQMSREVSGGEMATRLASASAQDLGFIRRRIGREADGVLEALREQAETPPFATRVWRRIQTDPLRAAGEGASRLRDAALRLLLGGEDFRALRLGRFRRAGEIHLWMYDERSLSRLLLECGFADPRNVGATESSIPGWADFQLDADDKGSAHKPDSLFMEAKNETR